MNLFSYIKQQLPILDIVQEYATLKKAGYYWKGCCPFHHERTGSFTVSPHKEIFYCFGCHAGGDVISFIAKIEHCSPLEAAQHLVERYSIRLPQNIVREKSSDTYKEKKSYQQTCTIFAQWCHSQLLKSSHAYDYVLNRTISKESIQTFSIGYCPTDTKHLLAYAQKEGILAQNLLDAHIIKEGNMGLYLAFDERVIFPIKDHLGATVGFGGRVFNPDDHRPKYYNSHDHTYFNKGTVLFGLDRAKKAIAQKEAAFLVEGYTDLIIMHQFGYLNTVATLGTACTLNHLKHLARYAQRLYIMYDSDAAGHNAIMRLVELCWQVSIDPYVITLPRDDDPASYLIRVTNLDEPYKHAHDIFSFVVHHLTDNFSQKSLQEKLAITKKVVSLITTIQDPLKRDLLLQQASDAFKVPLETLQQSRTPTRYAKVPQADVGHEITQDQTLFKLSQLEKKLFSVILSYKEVISNEDEHLLSLLLDMPLKKIFDAWRATKTNNSTNITALFEQLTEDEKAFISHCITTTTQASAPDNSVVTAYLTHIYKKQWKKKVHNVKLRIDEAERCGDRDQVARLLNDLTILKQKMLGRGI